MRCPRNIVGLVKNCRIILYNKTCDYNLFLCNDCGKEWLNKLEKVNKNIVKISNSYKNSTLYSKKK
jgi:hypothetical protein